MILKVKPDILIYSEYPEPGNADSRNPPHRSTLNFDDAPLDTIGIIKNIQLSTNPCVGLPKFQTPKGVPGIILNVSTLRQTTPGWNLGGQRSAKP